MYYVDSSENASEDMKDAISVWQVEGDARNEAILLATSSPGTIYYVRKSVTTSVLVFQATATLTLESEIIDPSNPS